MCVCVLLDKMESTVDIKKECLCSSACVCVCVRLFQSEMTEKAYKVNNIMAARSTSCRRFE